MSHKQPSDHTITSQRVSGKASSQDLNALVDEILNSKRMTVSKKEKKRRVKMTEEQEGILEAEFDKNANWNHELYQKLESRLKTTKKRIYKWNWDRKKKA